MPKIPGMYRWGLDLRRFLQSDGYLIADRGFDTWTRGGCLLLARTLVELLGDEAHLMAIKSSVNEHEHVLVEFRGWYMDGDGASRKTTLLRRWWEILWRFRDAEHDPNPKIVPFNPDSLDEDWFYDAQMSARLLSAMRKVLPPLPEE